ncbi:hypothetical protein CONPUDRAFT_143003 [Coniophora puteana RWD-64-598 SS2]|uniref:Uncharacterized protein n=1 Tax=Coniophora puteana (strain RWD-64-598) TaxID=741705 RepID=A0A5M3MV64_CONPW|nr:uncharacterized protein CONPUDRAFT_143003 [Coniophora puteana RWD-64-598 SS2]EIW82897.1 hypothetical protein CONPUDRAFT_143003 [Coniophora puteana RWD-64-598 SS2]
MMSVVSAPSAAHGSVRRKPQFTYPSPTAHVTSLRIEVSATVTSTGKLSSRQVRPNVAKVSSSSTSPASAASTSTPLNDKLEKRNKTLMGPPLPLYHPLGRLATSLPDLDPTAFGLPVHPNMSDDPSRRFPSHSRRPASRLRDVAEDEGSSQVVDAVPVESFELKDKPSPRKRRAAGGAAAKRKRKDVDDGDATYPAKRSRNPRAAASAHANQTPVSEASPPNSANRPASPPDDDADGADGADDNKKPERRTTRSRANLARRDSVGSDATVTSASVSIAATTTLLDYGIDGSQPPTSSLAEGDAGIDDTAKSIAQSTGDITTKE